MERMTFKKWFEHYKPDEETTTLLVDNYEYIVENEEFTVPSRSHYYLVGEAVDKLAEYEDLEEQGLLIRLNSISVNDVVDKLFSHNEIISLWTEEKEEISYHKRIWYGMAWDIPNDLKRCKFIKIFGTIPESITHADIINIEVVLSEEAEQALERRRNG